MNCKRCSEPGEFRPGRKICRVCESAQRSQNRRSNIDRERQYKRDWRAANKDRQWLYNKVDCANGRGAEGKITYAEVAALFGSNPICGMCGTANKKNLQLDHIVPIEKNGPNLISNCGILCKKCNKKKGTRMPEQMGDPLVKMHFATSPTNNVTFTTSNGITVYNPTTNFVTLTPAAKP